MIPTSDLRKGNLVKTEHGILPVHHIVFNDVYVLGKDGRVLYARNIEGVEIDLEQIKEDDYTKLICKVCIKDFCAIFFHELQNMFYWTKRKELTLKDYE